LFNKWTFEGGIHIPYNKRLTQSLPIENYPLPQKIVVPVLMHIGAPAKVVVKVGDNVSKGQCVAEADGFVSSPAFSSISGIVSSIGMFKHISGKLVTGVEITADGRNDELRFEPIKNWREQSPSILMRRIGDCGIVGMGGAGFPTQVKLLPHRDKKVNALIINAAECEPYLTTDHRLMLEETDKILKGVKILQKILSVRYVFISIEKNKTDAIYVMKKKATTKEYYGIKIIPLETKYPQGGEKQLISTVLNREVPSGKLPIDAACVVLNVASAAAVCDAVLEGIPLTERVITVTGNAVKRPGNYIVPIGTYVKEILEYCRTDFSKIKKVIAGGPMMGKSLPDICVPVMKQTSGLLVLDTITPSYSKNNCINCGNCVKACSIHLVPSLLAKYFEKDMYEEALKRNVMDCMECGCCSYVCPAKINILHRIRTCKSYITQKRAKESLTQVK
jgi:electron transport complex protein RnfC